MVIGLRNQFLKSSGINLYDSLLLTLCLLFPLSVSAESLTNDTISPSVSIDTLLQQYVHNGSSQIFNGTFVYLFEDKVQTVKVKREKNESGKIVEDFEAMDSSQKDSSRILENHFCLLDNQWRYQFQALSSSFPFRVNNFYQQLQQYYDFSLSDVETVAGVPAIGVNIKGKDSYRYGYQLWFEPETATLLKYKLMDQKGHPIEQYFFTDIEIQKDPQLQKKLKPLSQTNSCHDQFKGIDNAFHEHFFKNKIPAGYELISYRKGHINDTERQAYQFQLSDGLSSVSIFIEENKPSGKTINGVIKLGPVYVAGKTVGDHQITVIGAIPIVSALNFIQAVKLSAPEYSSVQSDG